MKIRTKLNLGFLLTIFFLLVVGVTGIVYLSKVGKLSTNIYNNDLLPVFTTAEIESLIIELNLSVDAHLMAEDPEAFTLIEEEIKEKYKSINKNIAYLETDHENDSHQENHPHKTKLLKNLKTELADFQKINDNIIKLSREFYKEDGIKKTHHEIGPVLVRIKTTINQMMSTLKDHASNDLKISRRDISTSTKSIVTVIIIGFLLSLSTGLIISGSITRPIAKAVDVFGMVARGNTRNKLDDSAKDEIGDLARASNGIVDVIDSLITEVQILTEAAVEGRLDTRGDTSKFQGDYADIVKGLNNTLDAIVGPITLSAEYIERISKGDIPEKISNIHKGDFQRLNNSINKLISHLKGIIRQANQVAQGDLSTNILLFSDEDELGSALRLMNKSLIEVVEQANAIAKGDFSIEIVPHSKRDELGTALANMTAVLREVTAENEKENWLKTGQTELNDRMRGEQDIAALSQNIISYLAAYLNAQIGAIYLADENNLLKLAGGYAYTKQKNLSNEYKFGESLTGQAALEKEIILTTNVPDDYINIHSGLGKAAPHNIVVVPLLYDGKVKGVLELGSFHEITDVRLDLLREVAENIAISLNSAQSRLRMTELLKETQRQAEELETRQEELRQTNEELEEQTHTLEKQQDDLKKKNTELEKARRVIEQKAKELETSSKYKSQFLANMSHELRTPLNSLLLLSNLLMENKDGNLTDKQVDFARTIHIAGSDLLNLINDILDLSKIEAGKMELNPDNLDIDDFLSYIERNFRHMAQEKRVSLKIDKADGLPAYILTDRQRLKQIIKNLLSNAFKFTTQGGIIISIRRPGEDMDLSNSGLDLSNAVAIAVSDTGIGIPKDKQKLIFEAFKQVDGTTSRQYGGTGLGLSISRELAKLLGGEIRLQSIEGKGSTFTLYLPERLEKADKEESRIVASQRGKDVAVHKNNAPVKDRPVSKDISFDKPFELEDIRDDRRNISPGDKTILIIEDDPKFAKILYNLALEKGFKGLIAGDGEAGLHLADYYRPNAIILDIGLPRMDGWTVMERLKDNPETCHIPVHFMSVCDKSPEAMKMGAIGYLTKPVSMEKLNEAFRKINETISGTMKNLLIVEDDESERNSIVELIGSGDIMTTAVGTGRDAYELLKSRTIDCMILGLGPQDMSGFELLEKIGNDKTISPPPIIIYTGRELSEEEETRLKKHAESIIIKGVRSPERLLDEIALFLHHVEANLPEEKQKMLRMARDNETVLKDKKILLTDDDMRSAFALSNVLEERGMKVLIEKNGREALKCLDKNPDINLVLMDIMMSEMDGYEAMREIRKQERFKKLPVIALTAKAMRGDREKCIDAGASDYLAKPVDVDKLLSLLRVWL